MNDYGYAKPQSGIILPVEWPYYIFAELVFIAKKVVSRPSASETTVLAGPKGEFLQKTSKKVGSVLFNSFKLTATENRQNPVIPDVICHIYRGQTIRSSCIWR